MDPIAMAAEFIARLSSKGIAAENLVIVPQLADLSVGQKPPEQFDMALVEYFLLERKREIDATIDVEKSAALQVFARFARCRGLLTFVRLCGEDERIFAELVELGGIYRIAGGIRY